MHHRTVLACSIALLLIRLSGMASAAGENVNRLDPFAFDGAKNILEERHFGIINGQMTCGIPYKNATAIHGLWSPPYVSTDFQVNITVMGRPIATDRYTWHPCSVERAGSTEGIAIKTTTMLIPKTRVGLVEVTLTNTTAESRSVPIAVEVTGTLDLSQSWEFDTPKSKTATVPKIVDGALQLQQNDMAIVLRAGKDIPWKDGKTDGQGEISLPASGRATFFLVFAIGPMQAAVEGCQQVAADTEKAMADAKAAYAAEVQSLFQKLPTLKSNNAELEKLYNRSLVHLVTNRFDVDEFVLHPYYGTGGMLGGCVCCYLWNVGENWEIMPLLDPEATKEHIKKFLAVDMTQHFAWDPITGKAFGPWYMVNQEKIIGLIYYYVKNTGDTAFLKETVDGKTVLEHMAANAMFGDDPTKPVAMIDYTSSNSHLELRRGWPYNHVMPDLNGRRYNNYVFTAELTELMGDVQTAAMLRDRAKELKVALKQRLWDPALQWFIFEDENGEKNIRYTVQMFKLFNSDVLDSEEESALLAHLNNEKEFLSEYGLHSLSKTDPAYDPADVDNGGPGACTCFPPQIAERLYKAGHADSAENILKRILWWGDRMPYWGDSIVADKIDYRHDTPLQCTSDGATVAQCIIFGAFGVEAQWNGDIRINPKPPKFAPQIAIEGLRIRGHLLDIRVDGDHYDVNDGSNHLRMPIGRAVLVQDDKFVSDNAAQ